MCKKIVERLSGQLILVSSEENVGTTFEFSLSTGIKSPVLTENRFVDEYRQLEESKYGSDTSFTDRVILESNRRRLQHSMAELMDSSPHKLLSDLAFMLPCTCEKQAEVLIVDDNPFNITALSTILEFQFGLPSEKALNGEIAVEVVRARHAAYARCACKSPFFKVIFMDINMPVKDGLQATREILQLCSDSDLENLAPRIVPLTAYDMESLKGRFIELGITNFLTKPANTQLIKEILQS